VQRRSDVHLTWRKWLEFSNQPARYRLSYARLALFWLLLPLVVQRWWWVSLDIIATVLHENLLSLVLHVLGVSKFSTAIELSVIQPSWTSLFSPSLRNYVTFSRIMMLCYSICQSTALCLLELFPQSTHILTCDQSRS
jgi:hypothetical protein